MIPVVQKDLSNAVSGVSLALVQKAFESGADPNFRFSEIDGNGKKSTFLALVRDSPFFNETTIAIVKEFLKAGMAPELCSYSVNFIHGKIHEIKARNKYGWEKDVEFLQKIVHMLLEHETSGSIRMVQQTVPTAKSTIQVWKNLLFSEEFCDVTFVFSTGNVRPLPAHKCVLAAASPYFQAYFEGPWSQLEGHENGIWKTEVPRPLMKAVLTYIYTGELMEPILFAPETLAETLSVAIQYQLEDLQSLTEGCLQKGLNLENVKDVLLLANLHNATGLKSACFAFIGRHAAKAMFDPSLMSLAVEHPDLWTELSRSVIGESAPKASRSVIGESALNAVPHRRETWRFFTFPAGKRLFFAFFPCCHGWNKKRENA